MAKRLFPTRKKKAPATHKRTRVNSTTFIQRSRSESSEQKAIWNQVTGAGKSHVRRQFFGLTEEEQQSAKTALEAVIEARLKGTHA